MSLGSDAQDLERLQLIDLFRTVSALFIVFFHTWMIFHSQETSFGSEFTIFILVEKLGRPFFVHSGLFVMAISFFLFGYNKKNLNHWRLVIFFFGIFMVQYRGDDTFHTFFEANSWRWGVFTFLITVYLFLLLTQGLKDPWKIGLYLSSVFLFAIQSYQVTAYLDVDQGSLWRQMLVGSEIEIGLFTGWYLLPWFSYPIFFFGLGLLARNYINSLSRIHLFWDLLLLVILGFSVVNFLSGTPHVYLDGRFDKSIFDKDFLMALPIFMIPILVFRLSLLRQVNLKLENKYISWVSKLAWNRYFWLAYLLHFFFLYSAFYIQKGSVWSHSPFAEVLPFMAIVFAESMARALVAQLPLWRQRFIRWGFAKG
jgi:hypothetical protein